MDTENFWARIESQVAALDLEHALPVILSLIVIEALLSVDNALAIAAMASHLPGRQKFIALRLGMIGAYVFRGLVLAFASVILEHLWVKVLGAVYLLHLAADHFAQSAEREEEEAAGGAKLSGRGFWATVVAIELMDLSLSVDNVVAAVAMSPHLWAVCTGVFIGILALRFVAGYCIRLIEKFPILESAAFLLIAFVGMLLLFELGTHRMVSSQEKFAGVVSILGASIAYARIPVVRGFLKPFVEMGRRILLFYAVLSRPVMGLFFRVGEAIFIAPWRWMCRLLKRPTSQ